MKDCKNYFIKVNKKDVVFYAPFFEAFCGMLSLRTPSKPKDDYATIHILVSPDFIIDFENILKKWVKNDNFWSN